MNTRRHFVLTGLGWFWVLLWLGWLLPEVAEVPLIGIVGGVVAAIAVLGMAEVGGEGRAVKADRILDADGRPKCYTLTLAKETITLEPGKAWVKADLFKWVTRGLIEPPQSYHVLANGLVEINGEKVAVDAPDGTARLEREINKHHAPAGEPRPTAAKPGAAAAAASSGKVQYHVKLDHLGHLMVDCLSGGEHIETGMRGLSTLIQNGLMLAPGSWHVDPLQRAMEIDGQRFACDEAGARELEVFLNAHYAPTLKGAGDNVIEVKENPASATGFDLHFVTFHAGLRLEVKGHLSQEKLDLLQDASKCDLLQHGILLRLTPPNLLIRRRRTDGGEERIPELPDVAYRRVAAAQLQQVLNHPLIRRSSGGDARDAAPSVPEHAREFREIRVVRSPQNPTGFWLECVAAHTGKVEGMALTYHNVGELQARGIFLDGWEVALSLDQHVLRVVSREASREESFRLDPSDHPDLERIGQRLTGLLKPPSAAPPPAEAPAPAPEGAAAGHTVSGLPEMPLVPEAIRAPVVSPPARMPAHAPPIAGSATGAPAAPSASDRGVPTREAAGKAVGGRPPDGRPPKVAEGSASATPQSPDDALEREPAPDPIELNLSIFQRLSERLDLPVQDLHLSLPRVFHDRRFEVLSFSHPQIEDLSELRSEEFYGFYLSHVDPAHIILVYACRGRHIEWGPQKCVVQSSMTAEAEEYAGSALRGLAQDGDGNFLFVVTRAFRAWIRPREKEYLPVCVRFLSPEESLAEGAEWSRIWPEA